MTISLEPAVWVDVQVAGQPVDLAVDLHGKRIHLDAVATSDTDARNLIFFYHDPNTAHIRLHAIKDYIR